MKSERGMAMMERNKMVKNVVKVNCVSDSLIRVKFKAAPMNILVMLVLMPKSNHSESELEQIYDKIRKWT